MHLSHFSKLILFLFALVSITPLQAASTKVRWQPHAVVVTTSQLSLACNLTNGSCNYHWKNGGTMQGATCAARLADGTELDAAQYTQHECAKSDIVGFSDRFGRGRLVTIHHRQSGRPELRQQLCIYDQQPFCLMSVAIVSATPQSCNYIVPLAIESRRVPGASWQLNEQAKPQILLVPFDNDAHVRYNDKSLQADGISYEVSALYDNPSRQGFVIGSITHDLWKTGIVAHPGSLATGAAAHDSSVATQSSLLVYGGANSQQTRDTQPHGFITGTAISSPRIFVGYFPDWRDGLETFGQANAQVNPPLPWTGGVPFGWNSWAAYGETINYSRYLAASDFFATHLPSRVFANNPVYINFDSYWDNLSEAQLVQAAQHVHANGQKVGIYWTPFTYWGDDLARPVEGTDGRYTYRDILLKDTQGEPLPKLDGGRPLDPSHPGTLARIDWQMERFVRWGYDFVKLDFMSHGSLEGAHFDPHITTGVAAYNLGMKRIVADLQPQKIGRPLFISLSIAPLFPAGYAHSRRISCDTFAYLDDTEYMLNSLTYGWWMNNTLYRFNDPDHAVLYKPHWNWHPPSSETIARTRLNASVIAGTVLLDSDDLADPAAQNQVANLLSNAEVNALAAQGRTFRPLEGDTNDHAASTFLRTEPNGTRYLAVFNYDPQNPTIQRIDLARLGLNRTTSYCVYDLWTKAETRVQNTLQIPLAPGESKLLRLNR